MNSLFPLTCSDDLPADRDFYRHLLGLEVAFENDWYVQLRHPRNGAAQMAFVRRDHDSVPEGHRARPAGVIVTVEVDEVDPLHARARELSLPIVQELRDEHWGQRHFITRDPSGLLVDLVQLIPPSAEYASGYAGG